MEQLNCLAPDADEPRSSSEETFAGVLVLMTAHAEAPAHQRAGLARQVRTQLLRVAGKACASDDCRLALSVLAAHWAAISDDRADPDEDIALRHFAPAMIQ